MLPELWDIALSLLSRAVIEMTKDGGQQEKRRGFAARNSFGVSPLAISPCSREKSSLSGAKDLDGQILLRPPEEARVSRCGVRETAKGWGCGRSAQGSGAGGGWQTVCFSFFRMVSSLELFPFSFF